MSDDSFERDFERGLEDLHAGFADFDARYEKLNEDYNTSIKESEYTESIVRTFFDKLDKADPIDLDGSILVFIRHQGNVSTLWGSTLVFIH